MRFYVEPSPSGAWFVKLAGVGAPVSRHDTEEEAIARRDAYARGAAREDGERVELRDGTAVRIRPIGPDDKPFVLQAFGRLGAGSRYRRFLTYKKELSVGELRALTEVDHHDHEALGAVDPATGDGIGIARFVRHPDRPDAAEAAVTVVDEWQGRGVGAALLERLAVRAREEGIGEFTATLLSDNARDAGPVPAPGRPARRARRPGPGDRRRPPGGRRGVHGRDPPRRRPGRRDDGMTTRRARCWPTTPS